MKITMIIILAIIFLIILQIVVSTARESLMPNIVNDCKDIGFDDGYIKSNFEHSDKYYCISKYNNNAYEVIYIDNNLAIVK